MEIRRFKNGDSDLLRDVRLRALRDAPFAFSSWLERELAHPPEFWEGRVEQSELGKDGAIFAAIEDERCLGMAGGYFAREKREVANLWGMWVEPEARRRGLGRALVEQVADWARESGARGLLLDVTVCEEAEPAVAFYRRLGFENTRKLEHPESNRPLTALVMSRPL
jgi:GNAT superfamily N-acetyltransferase